MPPDAMNAGACLGGGGVQPPGLTGLEAGATFEPTPAHRFLATATCPASPTGCPHKGVFRCGAIAEAKGSVACSTTRKVWQIPQRQPKSSHLRFSRGGKSPVTWTKGGRNRNRDLKERDGEPGLAVASSRRWPRDLDALLARWEKLRESTWKGTRCAGPSPAGDASARSWRNMIFAKE